MLLDAENYLSKYCNLVALQRGGIATGALANFRKRCITRRDNLGFVLAEASKTVMTVFGLTIRRSRRRLMLRVRIRG
jgi:hypothetical protein